MNWQHFKTFVWLRWRLLYNQSRRAGTLNLVLMMIVVIGAIATAVPLLIGSFALGTYLIHRSQPVDLLYAWDILIAAYLFFWMLGLITELQRTEPLSLSRFLHLPVSVGGAFTINYLSSLVRLSLIVFGPIMLGFALALVYVKGPKMLFVLPLLAAFLLMVSALTYQFQGWLASMMSNPRRRRTVMVTVTTGFVLIAQLPNLLNVFGPWGAQQQKQQIERVKAQTDRTNALLAEYKNLDEAFRSKRIDQAEYMRRQQVLLEQLKAGPTPTPADPEERHRLERIATIANTVLPIGWLPLGVMTGAEGQPLPPLLAFIGLSAIGAGSLWRAYRTTLQIYQGEPTNRKRRPAVALVAGGTASTALAAECGQGRSLLEAHLPGISEPVSAVALGSLRSLLRSPEAKMMLLTPIILIPITGSMILKGGSNFPELVRPLLAVGGMIMVLFGVLQLMGNQFGFDRDGFRVYILSAIRRRDILLGKNLAIVPIVAILAAVVLAVIQFMMPMRWDHLLATIPQYISMYLLFCILANAQSILAPAHIAAGTLKPSNPKLTAVLWQLFLFLIAFPLTQSVVLLPIGAEALAQFEGLGEPIPVYLVLSLVECAAIVALYRFALEQLGNLFQAREQKILESVIGRGN